MPSARRPHVPGGPSRQIPEFILTPCVTPTRRGLGVLCRRCDHEFTVLLEWEEEFAGQTRPCPWCFAVSVVPPHPAHALEPQP